MNITVIKTKLRTFYLTYKVYLNLTFSLIMVAFLYTIHKGDLKYIVEVLKVAQALIQVLAGMWDMMSINKATIRYILAGILLGVLITGLYFTSVRRGGNTNVHQPETSKTSTITSKLPVTTKSTLSVTKKTTESEPDLIVSNKYVAKIDGKLVEAPIKNVSYKDKNSTTATVSTTIDVTPLVKQMTPKWEAGVGIGYVDNDVLPCMTLQRNYKHDKAVEAVIQIDTNGNFKGASLVHKWRF